MRWLVTGAAGYIGSHVVRSLLAEGHGVLAVDDLSTGLAGRAGPPRRVSTSSTSGTRPGLSASWRTLALLVSSTWQQRSRLPSRWQTHSSTTGRTWEDCRACWKRCARPESDGSSSRRPARCTARHRPAQSRSPLPSYLAEAHLAAATSLVEQSASKPRARAFNVSTGRGYSVLEVLDAVRDVTGTPYRPVAVDRRPGDPAEVVGDVGRAERELGWRARFGLMEVIRSAWDAWEVTARLTAT